MRPKAKLKNQIKSKSKEEKDREIANAFLIARKATEQWLATRGRPYQVPDGYPPRSLPASINDGFN